MKEFLKRAWLLAAVVAILMTPFLTIQTAYARGEQYIYNYTLKAGKFDVNSLVLYGKGGVFGNTPVKLSGGYGAGAKKSNYESDTGIFKDGSVNFSYKYKCDVDGKLVTGDEQSIDPAYYDVELAFALSSHDEAGNKTDDWSKASGMKGAPFLRHITTWGKLPANKQSREIINKENDGDDGNGGLNGESIKRSKILDTPGCVPDYDAGGGSLDPILVAKNYNQLSDAEKADWPGGDDTTPPDDGGGGGGSADDTPCLGGPIGWILCPLIDTMADGIRAVAGFIDSLMQFKLLLNNDPNQENQMREIWLRFVGVANIAMVIGFLYIIFSQASGAGLSNYGVKRMLPRLVIAAILINVSFYVCALAIDISNILGNGVMGFISGQGIGADTISAGIGKETHIEGPGTFNKFVSGALGGIIGVVLIVIFIVPLLIGVVITFVILVARQVVLLALVLVSPLAFAAWLLPNTEGLFTKWRKLFVNMLMVYPIVMMVFGVALFSSSLITSIAKTNDSETSALAGDALASIVALLVLAVPLLALPFILKSTSSVLGKVGAYAQRFGGDQAKQKLHGKTGGAIKRAPGVRTGFEMMNDFKQGREDRYKRGSLARQNRRLTAGGVRGGIARRVAGGMSPEGQARALATGVAGQAREGSEAAENAEFILSGSRAAAEATAAGHATVAAANAAAAAEGRPTLQGSDAVAFERFMAAGGAQTVAGARAAASVLAKTGGLDQQRVTQLNQQALANAQTDEERGEIGREFTEHINKVARENANMDYLSESTTGDNGEIILGGQRMPPPVIPPGATPAQAAAVVAAAQEQGRVNSINTELNGKGVGGVQRQFLEDGIERDATGTITGVTADSAAAIAGQRIHAMGTGTGDEQTQLRRELAKMDDRKLRAAANAAHHAGGVGAHEADALAILTHLRTQGRTENPGVT